MPKELQLGINVYLSFWDGTELTGSYSTAKGFSGPEKQVYTQIEDVYKLTLERIARRKMKEQDCPLPLSLDQVKKTLEKNDSVTVFQTDHYTFAITKWTLA